MKASDAAYGEPTSESALALAEARRRRALPGYVSGDSIRRKLAQPVVLPQVDRDTLLRWAGIPQKEWGMTWQECPRMEGELFGLWKTRAQRDGHFCVVDGNREAYEWMRDWNPSEGSCYISGPVGTGKSLLASAKCEQLLTEPVCLTWDATERGYRRTGGVGVLFTDETALARAQRAHR